MPDNIKLTPRQSILINALDLADPQWRDKVTAGQIIPNFYTVIDGVELDQARAELADLRITIERDTASKGFRLVAKGADKEENMKKFLALREEVITPAPEPITVATNMSDRLTERQNILLNALDMADPNWKNRTGKKNEIPGFYNNLTEQQGGLVRAALAEDGIRIPQERVTKGNGILLKADLEPLRQLDAIRAGLAPVPEKKTVTFTRTDTPAPVAKAPAQAPEAVQPKPVELVTPVAPVVTPTAPVMDRAAAEQIIARGLRGSEPAVTSWRNSTDGTIRVDEFFRDVDFNEARNALRALEIDFRAQPSDGPARHLAVMGRESIETIQGIGERLAPLQAAAASAPAAATKPKKEKMDFDVAEALISERLQAIAPDWRTKAENAAKEKARLAASLPADPTDTEPFYPAQPDRVIVEGFFRDLDAASAAQLEEALNVVIGGGRYNRLRGGVGNDRTDLAVNDVIGASQILRLHNGEAELNLSDAQISEAAVQQGIDDPRTAVDEAEEHERRAGIAAQVRPEEALKQAAGEVAPVPQPKAEPKAPMTEADAERIIKEAIDNAPKDFVGWKGKGQDNGRINDLFKGMDDDKKAELIAALDLLGINIRLQKDHLDIVDRASLARIQDIAEGRSQVIPVAAALATAAIVADALAPQTVEVGSTQPQSAKKQKMSREEGETLVAGRLSEMPSDWSKDAAGKTRVNIDGFFAVDAERAVELDAALAASIGRSRFDRLAGGLGADRPNLVVKDGEAVRLLLALERRNDIILNDDTGLVDNSAARAAYARTQKSLEGVLNVSDAGIELLSDRERALRASEYTDLRLGVRTGEDNGVDTNVVVMGPNGEIPAAIPRAILRTPVNNPANQRDDAARPVTPMAARIDVGGDTAPVPPVVEAQETKPQLRQRDLYNSERVIAEAMRNSDQTDVAWRTSTADEITIKGFFAGMDQQQFIKTLEALDEYNINGFGGDSSPQPRDLVVQGEPSIKMMQDIAKRLAPLSTVAENADATQPKAASEEVKPQAQAVTPQEAPAPAGPGLLGRFVGALGALNPFGRGKQAAAQPEATDAQTAPVAPVKPQAAQVTAPQPVQVQPDAQQPQAAAPKKGFFERFGLKNMFGRKDADAKPQANDAVDAQTPPVAPVSPQANAAPKAAPSQTLPQQFTPDQTVITPRMQAAAAQTKPQPAPKAPRAFTPEERTALQAIPATALFKEGTGADTRIIINYLNPGVKDGLDVILRDMGVENDGGRRDFAGSIVIKGDNVAEFERIRGAAVAPTKPGKADEAIEADAITITQALPKDRMSVGLTDDGSKLAVTINRTDLDPKLSRAMKEMDIQFSNPDQNTLVVVGGLSVDKLEKQVGAVASLEPQQAKDIIKNTLGKMPKIELEAYSGRKDFKVKDVFAKLSPDETLDFMRAMQTEKIGIRKEGNDLYVGGDRALRVLAAQDSRVKVGNIDPDLSAEDMLRYNKVKDDMPLDRAQQVMVRRMDRAAGQDWAEKIGENPNKAVVKDFFEGVRKPQGQNRAESALKTLGIDHIREGNDLIVLGDRSVDALKRLNEVERKPETFKSNGEIPAVGKSNSDTLVISKARVRPVETGEPLDAFAAKGEVRIDKQTGAYELNYGGKTHKLIASEDPDHKIYGVREIVSDEPVKVGNVTAKYADEQGYLLNANGKRIQKDLPVGIQQGADFVQGFAKSTYLGVSGMVKDHKTGANKNGIFEAALAVAGAQALINGGPGILSAFTSAVGATAVAPWTIPVAAVLLYGTYLASQGVDEQGHKKGLKEMLSDVNKEKAFVMAVGAVATVVAASLGLMPAAAFGFIMTAIMGNEMTWSNKEAQRASESNIRPAQDKQRPANAVDRVAESRVAAAAKTGNAV